MSLYQSIRERRRDNRRRHPSVEALEGRALLSTIGSQSSGGGAGRALVTSTTTLFQPLHGAGTASSYEVLQSGWTFSGRKK